MKRDIYENPNVPGSLAPFIVPVGLGGSIALGVTYGRALVWDHSFWMFALFFVLLFIWIGKCIKWAKCTRERRAGFIGFLLVAAFLYSAWVIQIYYAVQASNSRIYTGVTFGECLSPVFICREMFRLAAQGWPYLTKTNDINQSLFPAYWTIEAAWLLLVGVNRASRRAIGHPFCERSNGWMSYEFLDGPYLWPDDEVLCQSIFDGDLKPLAVLEARAKYEAPIIYLNVWSCPDKQHGGIYQVGSVANIMSKDHPGTVLDQEFKKSPRMWLTASELEKLANMEESSDQEDHAAANKAERRRDSSRDGFDT